MPKLHLVGSLYNIQSLNFTDNILRYLLQVLIKQHCATLNSTTGTRTNSICILQVSQYYRGKVRQLYNARNEW